MRICSLVIMRECKFSPPPSLWRLRSHCLCFVIFKGEKSVRHSLVTFKTWIRRKENEKKGICLNCVIVIVKVLYSLSATFDYEVQRQVISLVWLIWLQPNIYCNILKFTNYVEGAWKALPVICLPCIFSMVRIAQKLDRAASCLEYFTTHEWRFCNENVQGLWENLSETDQKTFNFALSALHWPTYMEQYCLGTKRYVMKEELNTLPTARKHLSKWVSCLFSDVGF